MNKSLLLIILSGMLLLIILIGSASATIDACEDCLCGNNYINYGSGEQCDDNNTINGDGCSSTCQIEAIIIIPEIIPNPLICTEDIKVCAEVFNIYSLASVYFSCETFSGVHGGEMELESKNRYCAEVSSTTMSAIDGFNFQCTITAIDGVITETKTINTIYNCPASICGNNIIEDVEQCDDGINNNLACIAGYESFCTYCNNDCVDEIIEGPRCGDEECSNGETYVTCNDDCAYVPECGNNNIDLSLGEECDDGNLIDFDDCSSTCQIEEEEEEEEEDKPKKKKSYSSITDYELENECTPKWECSNWNECDVDVRHRNCVDVNQCSYAYDMPATTTGCEIISLVQVEENSNLLLWILSASVLILILLGLLQKAKN